MRQVDLDTWPRREHFRKFGAFDHPHFGLCANVDLTQFYPFVRQHDISFTVATMYVIARAANAIPEFRYRIRGETVVEHDIVHPSGTVLVDEELFSFLAIPYVESFPDFAAEADKRIASMRGDIILEDEPGKDDLLFMTSIPWVSFTGFLHPLHMDPPDSVPRFAWGKFFQDGEELRMPLSVQAHHALMDGVHMGRYYSEVQGYLDRPDEVLGSA
jgi:chloramphenicol O-acetyltransferase type A